MGSEVSAHGSLGFSVSGPVVRSVCGRGTHGPLTVDRKEETPKKRQTTLQMPVPGGGDAP